MPTTTRTTRVAWALTLALLAALAFLGARPLLAAGASSAQSLRSTVARDRQAERALSANASRLDTAVAALTRDVSILDAREAAAQAAVAADVARLAQTKLDLQRTRAALAGLRVRLGRYQVTLANQLRAQYIAGQPELVDVLLTASRFSDLLDRVDFLKRVSQRNASVVHAVASARDQTQRETIALAALEPRQRDAAVAVTRQRDALAVVRAAAQARQASLTQARDAQLAALRNTAAGRQRAQDELRRLQAQQAQSVSTAGPGGPWAIPWAIVQCESGGQNTPPNGASASGYYQMLDSTWKGLGGSTQHAYQAPKSEQDSLAAKLWAGGAGASNWVCAGLVHG